jgi:hypothetical protein
MVQPPIDLSAPHGVSIMFLVLCSVIFAGSLAWCGYRAVRLGKPLALFVLGGGLLATVIEPMLDNLGLLWFAKDNVGIAFHLFNRYLPVYVVLGYGFFFGGQAFLAYDGLLKGKRARFLWTLYAAAWVFDLAIESIGHLSGLYKYYGSQPFNLWGVPVWWMFLNPVLPVVAGLVFFRLSEHLGGVRSILAVPLLPMIYGAIYGGAGWPIFIALHSTTNTAVLYACGMATDACAVGIVGLALVLLLPSATADVADGTNVQPERQLETAG